MKFSVSSTPKNDKSPTASNKTSCNGVSENCENSSTSYTAKLWTQVSIAHKNGNLKETVQKVWIKRKLAEKFYRRKLA